MKISRSITIAAALLALISCNPIQVVVDENHSADFSNYKTYSFLGWQNNSDKILAESDKESLSDAFAQEFKRRGLQRVNSGGDMQISLYIIVDDKSAISGYSDHYGSAYNEFNYYGAAMGYGYVDNNYTQRSYRVGTMIIDVFDKTSKDQVWQGIAKKTISENPEKRKKLIPANIRALLRDFPIKPE